MEFTTVNVESRKNLDMRSGDTVKVYQKIQEKGKTRLQVFEGLVLARKHGTEPGATFTVRRVANGYGVEKIYPLYSPMIDKIEVIKRSKTGRSKLYHIRATALKQISKRMKMMFVNFGTEDKTAQNTQPEVAEEIKDEAAEAEIKNEADTKVEAEVEKTETPTEEVAETQTTGEAK